MAVTARDINVIKNQEKMCSLERQTSLKAGVPLCLFRKEVNDSIAVEEDEVKDITVNFKPEHLYYDMSGEKILLIFNHFSFKPTKYHRYKEPKKRIGTEKDVEALKNVFCSMGFKVMTYTDYDHNEIIGTMAKISRQDHSRTSCLAVAILTHGDQGGELHAADRPYLLGDITVLLENGHSTLVNKPKLFFIQACRGGMADAGRTVQYDGFDQNNLIVPTHSDFLFVYSTVEDYVSWRDVGGSWFIQELCKVLQQYHTDFDLLHLITITIRNVVYNYTSYTPTNSPMHNKKQNPEARFTLTKLIKF